MCIVVVTVMRRCIRLAACKQACIVASNVLPITPLMPAFSLYSLCKRHNWAVGKVSNKKWNMALLLGNIWILAKLCLAGKPAPSAPLHPFIFKKVQPSFHLFPFSPLKVRSHLFTLSPFHLFTFKSAQPSFHLFTFSPFHLYR